MKRIVALLTLATLGAVGLSAVVPPSVANASIIAPYPVPPPVNILPSVVTAGTNYVPGGLALNNLAAQSRLMRVVQAAMVDAQTQQALKAPTPTPAQTALKTKLSASFKMPAFKMGSLVKAAGAASVLMFAQDLVIGASHSALEMIGFNPEGLACSTGDAVVRFLAHVDCTEFDMTAEAIAQANSDISAGLISARVCQIARPDRCAKVLAINSHPSVNAGKALVVSFQIEGFPDPGSSTYNQSGIIWYHDGGGTTTNAGIIKAATGSSSSSYGGCLIVHGAGARCASSWDPPAPIVAWKWNVDTAAAPTPLEQVTADPERFIRCQITLSNGAKLVGDTVAFRESEGLAPPPNCPNEFPAEFTIDNITIWEIGGGETHELYNESTTPEWQSVKNNYPECLNGTCLLDLRNEESASCFADPGSCVDWYADPNKTTKFSCWYGVHSVALGECGLYAPTFRPDAKTSQTPYGDPFTGEPLPNHNPVPGAVPDINEGQPCFPEGWSVFNPLEWVMRPVTCAFQWAFVPQRVAVDQLMDRMHANFTGSVPGKISTALQTVFTGFVVPTGCEGVTVSLAWLKRDAFASAPFPDDFRMLQACPGDVFHPWAIFSTLVLGLGLVFIAFKTAPAIIGKIFTFTGIDG